MGLFELIVIVAVVAAAVTYVPSLIASMSANKNANGTVGSFTSPRSAYGDPIPYIFGTVQQSSPICAFTHAYYNDVNCAIGDYVYTVTGLNSIGLNKNAKSDAVSQYSVTLDLILCERIHRGGLPLGNIRLNSIYKGENLLFSAVWVGSSFGTSMSLLDFFENWESLISQRKNPFDIMTPYANVNNSSGWVGGVDAHIDSSGSGGNLIGGYNCVFDGVANKWTRFLGLEKVRCYFGSGNETPNAHIRSIASEYPAYDKFVRLVFENFAIGRSPQLEKISANITVSCPVPEIGDTLGLMPNGYDVNPVSVLYLLLTCDEFANGQRMPPVNIASFTMAQSIIYSEGLGLSYVMNGREKLGDTIEKILSHIDGLLFREPTDGTLHLVLNRKANTDAAPKFTEESVVSVDNFAKSTWEGTYGRVQLTYMKRGGSPTDSDATNVVQVDDPGAQLQSGVNETLSDQITTAYTPEVAYAIACRKLAVANSPLIKMDLKMLRGSINGSNFEDLRPGSVFKFSYSPYGIVNGIFRVLSIDYGTIDDNSIGASVIQDRFVPDPPAVLPSQISYPASSKPTAALTTVQIVTAPYPIARLGLSGPEAFTSASVMGATYPTVTGYNLDRFLFLARAPYASASRFDWSIGQGGETLQSGTSAYTACGQLAGGIASGPSLVAADTTLNVIVNGLTDAELASISTDGSSAGRCVVLIDSEWIWVRSITKGDGQVILGEVTRMLWDSPENINRQMPSHSTGALVWFINLTDPALPSKMAQPVASNATLLESYSDIRDNEVKYATGYGVGGEYSTYSCSLINSDPGRANVQYSTAISISDCASRPMPVRNAGGYYANGVAGSPSTVWLSASATSFTVVLDASGNGEFRDLDGRTPRVFSKACKLNSENNADGYVDETSPVIQGISQLWSQIGTSYGGIKSTYVIIDNGTSVYVQTLTSEIFTVNVPASSGSSTVKISIRRTFNIGLTNLAIGPSKARTITLTVNRT
jgi:hypothetical protein